MWRSILSCVALLVPAFVAGCASGPEPAPPYAQVLRVVDGDTVVVAIAGRTETVRLLGIDTPEVNHHDEPGECFGPEAAGRAAALMPAGSVVALYRDVEPRDRYGRLLAYVSATEVMINAVLVEEGYAEVMTIPPNDAMAEVLAQAQARARAESRGLWGSC